MPIFQHHFPKTCALALVVATSLRSGQSNDQRFYADIVLLDRVFSKIHTEYVDRMQSRDLAYAGIYGMLSILDGNTRLLSNSEKDSAGYTEIVNTSYTKNFFSRIFPGNIAYLRIGSINAKQKKNVKKALKEIQKNNCSGLICDLRNSPGGVLDECIEVADFMLPNKAKIGEALGRAKGQNRIFKSKKSPIIPDSMPIAILVNNRTNSGAEMIAAALQFNDRAAVIGNSTLGAASVTTMMPAGKKHILHITTAYLYSPSGICLDRRGKIGQKAFQSKGGRRLPPTPGVTPDISFDSSGINPVVDMLERAGLFYAYIHDPRPTESNATDDIFDDFFEYYTSFEPDWLGVDSLKYSIAESLSKSRLRTMNAQMKNRVNRKFREFFRDLLREEILAARKDISAALEEYLWWEGIMKAQSEMVTSKPKDRYIAKALALLGSPTEYDEVFRTAK